MRRFFLSATFLLLIAGLIALWNCRFERMPGASGLNLADLRKASSVLPPGAVWEGDVERPTLRLTIGPEHPRISLAMVLPDFPAMEALHIHFSMVARNLQLGAQEWDDGRVLIEWHSPDSGNREETDAICSLRDSQSSSDVRLIARCASGSSVPVLRIEHLGWGGEFAISQLEMIPVRERDLWIFGRWVMAALFFAWLWFLLSGQEYYSAWRRILTIGIWLGMAVYFAVPGPWKTLRPLVTAFEIGKPASFIKLGGEPTQSMSPSSTAARLPHSIVNSTGLGKIPLQGGWIVRVKHHLAMARPLLHALLLFVPTIVFALLVGPRLALALAFGMAFSIEAAQTAFGYGFDWVDVCDLLTDAAGILLAIRVFGQLKKSGRFSWVFRDPRDFGPVGS